MTQKPHILITGGLGFIGSHIAHALSAQENYTLTIFDNLSTGKRDRLAPNATLIEGDVANLEQLQPLVQQADMVIHLAAIASVHTCNTQRLSSHRTNVVGSVNVFHAAAHAQTPPYIIYASSAAVYGNPTVLPLTETTLSNPLSAYGFDKFALETEARLAQELHGLSSTGLRFFNVYGEHQDPHSPYSGVISRFADACLTQKPITIFGDGTQSRDFIYIGDITQLVLLAIEKRLSGAHIFNGCSGVSTSIHALATQISTQSGHFVDIAYAPARTGDIQHSIGCPKHAAFHLGFHAKTSLADGLQKLWQWMQHA